MANLTNQINFDKMNKLNEKHGDSLRRKMEASRPDSLVVKMQSYKEEQEIKPLIVPEFRDNPDAVRYALTWAKEGVPFIEINDRLEAMEAKLDTRDEAPAGPIEYIEPRRKKKAESFYEGLL